MSEEALTIAIPDAAERWKSFVSRTSTTWPEGSIEHDSVIWASRQMERMARVISCYRETNSLNMALDYLEEICSRLDAVEDHTREAVDHEAHAPHKAELEKLLERIVVARRGLEFVATDMDTMLLLIEAQNQQEETTP